ncbi:anti-sigma factor family protein [Mycobacterium sp.]|jgi:hypothetical protein|uniref:anti-sigma factor family protein n=1 Tax=Mycobacterium sp. TaxID=1785 RepID=UPI002D573C98|nr:zf-HC2 domain-containing protein [Mycobacterium sp.]HZA08727.1 zf-HC2 domain-containing protein [Mycobacterium sp.]
MIQFGDTHDYAMWDAAYVLGSLSSADRREYEEHLATCQACRDAVSELSGMPALLARLDRDDVAAIDDGDADSAMATPPLPQMLTSLLAKVSWRRRRSRMLTWTVAAAAAVVLALGVFVALQATPPANPTAPPQPSATAMTLMQVKPSEITATMTLNSHSWGTRIDMNCTYAAPAAGPGNDSDEAGDKLAMVVVGRDGTQAQLATWVGLAGVPATPGGSTSMPMREIAAVQIVSADTGEVLLQRSL